MLMTMDPKQISYKITLPVVVVRYPIAAFCAHFHADTSFLSLVTSLSRVSEKIYVIPCIKFRRSLRASLLRPLFMPLSYFEGCWTKETL